MKTGQARRLRASVGSVSRRSHVYGGAVLGGVLGTIGDREYSRKYGRQNGDRWGHHRFLDTVRRSTVGEVERRRVGGVEGKYSVRVVFVVCAVTRAWQ